LKLLKTCLALLLFISAKGRTEFSDVAMRRDGERGKKKRGNKEVARQGKEERSWEKVGRAVEAGT
jgi:hypothetical protein